MTWQQVGALQGGTVGGLALVETPAGPAIIAVTPAGGFRSDDGRVWRPLSPEPGPALADAVAASPAFSRDQTLFLGGRTGLFRSSDWGANWRHALEGEVLTVAVSPAFERDMTLFIGTGQDGVLHSEDGGRTWSGANSGLLDLSALAVALSPRFAEDRIAFVGTASGLYRSRNGGRSWREVRLSLSEPAVQVLAVSPRFADDRLVFAGTEADGLLRSVDGGARFEETPALAERGISALTIGANGQTVVVAAGSEALRSEDGGLTWTALPAAPGLVLGLALLPTPAGDVLIAGLHRLGIARLDSDGGWELANDGLRASLLTWLTPSPRFAEDRTLFGLSLDEGLLISQDGGRVWERRWPEDADPAIVALAAAAGERGVTLLASTAQALYRSADGGSTWEARPPEAAPPLRVITPLPAGGPGAAFVGVGAVQVDGHETAGIVRSDDGGLSWRPVGAIRAGEPGWSLQLGALAASPAFWQDQTLVARGTEARADGQATTRIWRSTDAGRSWSVWLEEAGSFGPILPSTLLMPLASPTGAAIVAAVGPSIGTPIPGSWQRQGGQRRPVWRWAGLTEAVASVTTLAAPPGEPSGTAAGRTIYAGTNAGPFVSRDSGRTFQLWAAGYNGGGIVALAVSPDFARDRLVFAVGVGGTIWQIEDAP